MSQAVLKRALLLCLTAAGCDRVLGLSHISDDGGGGDGDGQRTPITGTYLLHHSVNGPNGAPITTDDPYPSGDIVMQVVADDGATTPVEYRSDGTFSFDAPRPYRLRIRNPFG